MNWQAGGIGIAGAAAALSLMAVARVLVANVATPEFTVREVELATEPPPPPPPPPEPDEPPPEPPPAAALTDLEPLADPQRVPVAKAEVPMDVRLPVDLFSSEFDPAPLPVADAPPPRVARRPDPAPRPALPKPAAPPPPPAAKSHYTTGELDSRPRLLRHPSTSFPTELARRGVTKGTVVLEVELSERGAVRVRGVISASNPELVAKARQVAAGSRFTPPLRQGRPVKAVMKWPITIQQ